MLFQEYDNLWIIGQAIITILLFVNGVYLLILARKSQIQTQKIVYLGTSLFLLCCMIMELGYILDLYYRNFAVPPIDIFPEFASIGGPNYVYLMIVIFSSACIPLMYPLEKVLIQSKKLWRTAIAGIAFIVLMIPVVGFSLITDVEIRTLIAYIGIPFFAISVISSIGGNLFFYIRLGATSPGYVRKKSWSIGFGLILTLIAIMVAFLIEGTDVFTTILSPIILTIGLWLVLRGEQMKISQ